MYWPVFLIGWKIRQIGLRKVFEHTWVRVVSLIVPIAIFVVAMNLHAQFKKRWFTMNDSYSCALTQQ